MKITIKSRLLSIVVCWFLNMQVTENMNELVLHYYSLAPLQKVCAVLDFDPIFRQWALSSNDMNLESSKNIVSKSSKTRGTKIFTPGLIVAQTSSCRECVKTNATHMSYYCIIAVKWTLPLHWRS